MRPVYGRLGVPQSLTTARATFPEIFNGLLFRLSLNVRAKFEVPEIIGAIGVPEKIGQSLDTPTLPFLGNF